ncbi:MAG TPA: hypothetical protein EYN79_00190 [Planctomycetes bacterium]|nr:hypothetical protein [Planctomycetota bacterium]HIN80497.1 hypothetical protein [Planctomycetota bacterium]
MEFGEFLAREGAIDTGLAAQIDSAIDRREGTEVIDTRRRLPSSGGNRGAGARRPGVGRGRRKSTSASLAANPMQATIYIGSGVVALILLIFLAFQFQKSRQFEDSSDENTSTTVSSTTPKEVAEKAGTATPPPPVWSEEELRRMNSEIDMLISDVTKTAIEGRFAAGIADLKRKKEKLGGDLIPAEMRERFDREIQMLQQTIDEVYLEHLEKLRKARSENKEEKVLDILDTIENSCGAAYRERAEKDSS